jgi:type I restriction enzyme M protein
VWRRDSPVGGRDRGVFRAGGGARAPEAWIGPGSETIGYEVSFTRHFYKPRLLRTLSDIETEIRALERATEGLLEEILVATEN